MVAVGGGSSRKAVGRPNRLMWSALSIRQYRLAEELASRRAANSLSSTVSRAANAVPCGLSGPGGSASVFTSTTELALPSMAMSSRTQKMCWWIGADTCGATWRANVKSSPSRCDRVVRMPVSFTS